VPTFKFEAMNTCGGEVKNSVEARSEEEAVEKIKRMGYFVCKITEVPAVSHGTFSAGRSQFDVFVSHSKHDKPVADAVCHTLEANGLRCWIAPRDIAPGKMWSEAIIDGLESSKVFVLIFSANANQSGHVLREVERAVSKSLTIIPFRIEDVPPSRGLEYCISLPHWLDAMTPPLQQHINRLVHAVTANVGFASANDATSAIQLPESASFTISQDEQDEDKFSDEFEVPPLSDGDPSTGAMDSDEFELVLDDDTDLGRELVALDDDDDEFELELSSE
jgi:hypothetical protein